MGTSQLQELLSCIFPKEIVERFEIVTIARDGNHRLTLMLEELPIPPVVPGVRIESKGFAPERTIQDFPLRDRAVTLSLHCRRWRNADTGVEVHVPFDLVVPGTSYTREFADFLKALD
jgi:hypothetical protein